MKKNKNAIEMKSNGILKSSTKCEKKLEFTC